MRRCIMCDELSPMYIPDDVIDDYGIYSCGSCGFEIECARELPSPPISLTPADILAHAPHVSELEHHHTTAPVPTLVLAGSHHG